MMLALCSAGDVSVNDMFGFKEDGTVNGKGVPVCHAGGRDGVAREVSDVLGRSGGWVTAMRWGV